MKQFIKKTTLLTMYSLISFNNVFTFANGQIESNSTSKRDNLAKEVKFNKNESILEDKFNNDFENFQSFENSRKPRNQFFNLFGIGGFSDQRLKDSSFKLWKTFKKEMSNQIGNERLNGSDINNTFNDSLKTIENYK